MVADMLGSGIPLLNECGGYVGVFSGDDLHTLGKTRIAVMLDHDIGVRVVRCCDHQMECVKIQAGAMHLDKHRLLDLPGELDDGGGRTGIPFHCRNPVGRLGHRA